MNRLIGHLVVAASFWFLPDQIATWMPFENEVTVYMLSCDGEQVNGICRGNEKTDIPMTYKVLIDQNFVSARRMNDMSRPQRFPYCLVGDTKNWWCQWSEDEVPDSRFGMVAGKYAEITTCMSITTTQLYHQVPMWRWWMVWLHENLA
ncbi:hypothetical protein SB778_30295 [Paraburkholderia sp. SIMBA_050]